MSVSGKKRWTCRSLNRQVGENVEELEKRNA